MERLKWNLIMVENVLNRYSLRLDCSEPSLLAATYIATIRCYKGECYKRSIREGKRILDNLKEKENYNG